MAGGIEEFPSEDRSILAYIRTHTTGDALVVHNLSQETVTLSLKSWRKLNFRSENGVSFHRSVLTLPAGSTGILTGRKK